MVSSHLDPFASPELPPSPIFVPTLIGLRSLVLNRRHCVHPFSSPLTTAAPPPCAQLANRHHHRVTYSLRNPFSQFPRSQHPSSSGAAEKKVAGSDGGRRSPLENDTWVHSIFLFYFSDL